MIIEDAMRRVTAALRFGTLRLEAQTEQVFKNLVLLHSGVQKSTMSVLTREFNIGRGICFALPRR